MHFLQKAKQIAAAPKYSIIQRLRMTVGGHEKPRPHTKIHASAVTKTDFCARQVALIDLTKPKIPDEYIPTALQTTFDIGNALGDLFRENWAASWTYGHWECARCDEQRSFCTRPSTHGCKSPRGHRWEYREVNFVSMQSTISGSIDAICELGAPKLFVTELKIMAPADFDALLAPLAEHRLRTNLYLRLIDESNSPYRDRFNLQQGKVLYISRGYGKKHAEHQEILPWKEYDVERNDAETQQFVDRGIMVKNWRETGVMPAGVCATSMEKRAQKCSLCKACFSGSYPVGATHGVGS